MKLSLLVHANKNRGDRVQCLLTRLTLNAQLHPDVDFEVIFFDGGSTDNTKALCDHFAKYLDLKYIYCPMDAPTEETYPISVMKRVARGDRVGFVSTDHWISENLIRDMTSTEASFWFGKVAVSEDSKKHDDPVSMVDALLDDRCSQKELGSILEMAEIDPTSGPQDIWCHSNEEGETFGGGRKIEENVVAIDMWAPPQDFIEPEYEIGRLPEYGYAVIAGQVLTVEELECYIEQRRQA